jgi:hypothetical protein
MSCCLAHSPRFTNDDSFVGVYQLVATPKVAWRDGVSRALEVQVVREDAT